MSELTETVANRERTKGWRKLKPYMNRPLLDDESEQARILFQAHRIAYRRIRTDLATGAQTIIEEWRPEPQS